MNPAAVLTSSGDPAAGILAGYNPNNTDTLNSNIHGNVSIDDYASILAPAGTDGIRGVNYGTGTVTIIAEAGATITAGRYGIAAFGFDGGDVSVTNYATVTGGTAAIDAQATGSGAVLIDNYGTITGAVVSSAAAETTFHNEAGATWTASGSSSFTGPNLLINDGMIALNGTAVTVGGLSNTGMGWISLVNGASLEVGTAGGAAAGSITVDSGAMATLAGTLNSATFADNGTVAVAAGSFLTLLGSLSGSGQIDIGSNASFSIAGSVAPGPAPAIALQGAASALWLSSPLLDSTQTFAPAISGLSAGNAILFQGTVTNASYNSGVLTLLNNTTAVAHLNLSGNYQGASFYAVNINPGQTQIGISVGGDTSTAPTGTTAADNYVWSGGVDGSWDVAANWQDTTAAQSPASVAPGSNDNVTISYPATIGTGLSDVVTGIGNSASLTVDGQVDLAGQFTTGSLVMGNAAFQDGLALGSGASLLVTGAVTAATGTSSSSSSYWISGGSLTVDGAFTYAMGTAMFISNGGHVKLAGTTNLTGEINVDSTSSIEIGTAGGTAAGSIAVDNGVTTTLSGFLVAPTIVDNGTIAIPTGTTLTLSGALAGAGQIDIENGASLTVGSAAAASTTATILFQGNGTLTLSGADLDASLKFAPVISGLDATDKIDFQGAVTSAFWNNGVLTLENGTTAVAYLNLPGNYSTAVFTVTALSGGISQIVDPPAAPDTVASGAVLELSAPTADRVVFADTAGTLVLDQPASFQGQIAGISGAGDVLNLKGFNAGYTTADAVFNPLNDTTVLTIADASGHQSASLTLDGNYSSYVFNVVADPNGGVDVAGTGTVTIDAGATLELVSGASSGQTVVFSSTTGMLKLDQAENFNGVVSGFSTTDGTLANSDQIDLADINHHSSSFSEQFNSTTDTLTVTDGTKTAVIHFTGNVGNLSFADDGNLVGGVSGTSGTIVYDPPSTSQSVGAVVMHDPGQGVTPVTMQDPGPAPSSTIVATAPNQTLSGFAASDNFAFNFAGVGHATVADFHPLSDTLQFGNSIFASAQAALNATQDDGHGNTVISVDSHDSITLGGVQKAQLHAADFHIV